MGHFPSIDLKDIGLELKDIGLGYNTRHNNLQSSVHFSVFPGTDILVSCRYIWPIIQLQEYQIPRPARPRAASQKPSIKKLIIFKKKKQQKTKTNIEKI